MPAGGFSFILTGAGPKSAASVMVTTTAGGSVTGTAMVAGPDATPGQRERDALTDGFQTLVIKFKGQIDPNTKIATIPLNAGGIALTLTLTLNDDGTMTATITGTDGRMGASSPTFLLPARGQLNATAVVGRYSVAIGEFTNPLGFDIFYGTLTVDKKGKVVFLGTLPDGQKVSFATPLGSDYRFAARVPLYKKKGYLSITAKIDPEGIATAGFAFSVVPENSASVLKPGAGGFFRPNDNVSLHRYVPPGKQQQVTDSFAQTGGAGFLGRIALVSGGPNPDFTFLLSPSGKATSNAPGFTLKVFPKTGLFTGTEPSRTLGGKALPMSGAILQTFDTGLGFGMGFGNSRSPAGNNAIRISAQDLNGQ